MVAVCCSIWVLTSHVALRDTHMRFVAPLQLKAYVPIPSCV